MVAAASNLAQLTGNASTRSPNHPANRKEVPSSRARLAALVGAQTSLPRHPAQHLMLAPAVTILVLPLLPAPLQHKQNVLDGAQSGKLERGNARHHSALNLRLYPR